MINMIRTKRNTFYLVSTRFNKKTWNENEAYRDKRNITGCIYGSTKKISNNIPQGSILFVLEMLNIPKGKQNAPGKIMGIGLLRNCINNKRFKIYSDHTYNTYTYVSKETWLQQLKVQRNLMHAHFDLQSQVWEPI